MLKTWTSAAAAAAAVAITLAAVSIQVVAEPARTGPVNPYPASPNQLLTSSQLSKKVTGSAPEQVHLQIASPTEMWVMWSSGTSYIGQRDTASLGAAQLAAAGTPLVTHSSSPDGPFTSVTGTKAIHSSTFDISQSFPGASNYTSPVQCLVKLGGLQPNTRYYYTVGDSTTRSSKNSFRTLPAVGDISKPLRIGVFGDLGDTTNSTMTLQHLKGNDPDIILNVGDLSYADRHSPPVKESDDFPDTKDQDPNKTANVVNGKPSVTDGRRWDSWARLGEFLFSAVPHHPITGNHEIEFDSTGASFAAYKTRYPVSGTPQYPLANGRVTSNTFGWSSFEFGGVHVFIITPYLDHSIGSDQYNWLVSDLASVNRTATPFIIGLEHHPWYTTRSGGDYKGNACMRQELEPQFFKYGVDIFFNGHVHTYERSTPTYNYKVNQCGTTHILIGDGGNAGKVSDGYVDGEHNGTCPGAVPTAPGVDPGTDPKYNDGLVNYPTLRYCNESSAVPGLPWCASQQPEYSAYREPSFGHAIFTVLNATTATFEWHRNQDDIPVITDKVTLSADVKACPNLSQQGGRVRTMPSSAPAAAPSAAPAAAPAVSTTEPAQAPSLAPTMHSSPSSSTCLSTSQYLDGSSCANCTSSKSPFFRTLPALGIRCYNPLAPKPKSKTCGPYVLRAWIVSPKNPSKTTHCIPQSSAKITILLATKSKSVKLLSAGAYLKPTLRLESLKPATNARGEIIFRTVGGGRGLVQFHDATGFMRSRKGKTVLLTGFLTAGPGTTNQCFVASLNVCK